MVALSGDDDQRRRAWSDVSRQPGRTLSLGIKPIADAPRRSMQQVKYSLDCVMQGHGTPKESKSPPDGRASGTVRRSVDGGKSWEASVVLNGHNAYSYSCLSKVSAHVLTRLAWKYLILNI